jgi:hypothetical protein
MTNELFEAKFSSTPDDKKSYEYNIAPFIQAALSEFPRLKLPIGKINVYVESLANMLINNNKLLPHCYLYVLMKYPLFVNLISFNLVESEWNDLKGEILEELETLYDGQIKDEAYSNICMLLSSTAIDTSMKYFNYFIDFDFRNDFVGIDKDKLLSMGEYFLNINITMGMKPDSIGIIYSDIPKNKEKLLNIETIDSFIPYKMLKTSLQTVMCDFRDKQFNIIESVDDNAKVIIAINYNTIPEYFTVCCVNQLFEFSGKDVYDIINRKQLTKISSTHIKYYLNNEFYGLISSKKLSSTNLTDELNIANVIAKKCFNLSSRQQTINNVLNYDLSELIDKKEMQYFSIYMDGLKLSSVFNELVLSNYLRNYIFDDSLNN